MTFVFGKRLGKGSFGSVYEAMNTATGEMVAIKQIEIRSDRAHRQVRIEIKNAYAKPYAYEYERVCFDVLD